MTEQLPVIAAVPNYNMAPSLGDLLPQLLSQSYDAIYVLDDASSDNSREVVETYKGTAFVAGETNIGSGGNRNRILDVLPAKFDKAVIHFIDADCTLETADAPRKIRELYNEYPDRIMGGLIFNTNGLQSAWNWGPRLTLTTLVANPLAIILGGLNLTSKQWASLAYTVCRPFLVNYPNPTTKPVAREVFWISEANLFIPVELFRELGGFNAEQRVDDIFDMAVRMKLRGRACRFDPRVAVTQKPINVRKGSGNRKLQEFKSRWQLFRKYGLRIFY